MAILLRACSNCNGCGKLYGFIPCRVCAYTGHPGQEFGFYQQTPRDREPPKTPPMRRTERWLMGMWGRKKK
jgi:hypothetical protein